MPQGRIRREYRVLLDLQKVVGREQGGEGKGKGSMGCNAITRTNQGFIGIRHLPHNMPSTVHDMPSMNDMSNLAHEFEQVWRRHSNLGRHPKICRTSWCSLRSSATGAAFPNSLQVQETDED